MDDGSSDETPEVLGRYADQRLKIVRGDRNRGLIAVLNEGIGVARGQYIARMDADDIAMPCRLERQVSFLQSHREVDICGTWFWLRYEHKRVPVRTPRRHEEIAAHLFFRSAFGHPTVMLRRQFLTERGLQYNTAAKHAEDYDLWVRARTLTRFANVPEYLLQYRMHSDQTGAQYLAPQSAAASRVRLSQLSSLVPDATKAEQELHLRVCDGGPFATKGALAEARSWLDRLGEVNTKLRVFEQSAFADALAATWAQCCIKSRFSLHHAVPMYLSRHYSPFSLDRVREHGLMTRSGLRRLLAS